ncbi:MAG: 30S ribosomal protein S20 [Vulcanimicrobiaceae bacterium]
MPNIKAAVKWVRQSEKRRQRNLATKTRLKTLFKKAVAGAAEALPSTESAFDKAAQKGIIHPNKAARKKSRLVKAQRAATAAAGAVPATRSKKAQRSKA